MKPILKVLPIVTPAQPGIEYQEFLHGKLLLATLLICARL